MKEPFLEICVDTIDAALAAERGGANRIELCSALSEGGLTPSAGLMRLACQSLRIPVFPMIRPRGGDFFYSNEEFEIMKTDIALAKQFGAKGVVLGISKQDATVDIERTTELVKLANPLHVTFHRAFDRTPDLEQALEDVIRTGCRTILTSGGEAIIPKGIGAAENLYLKARARIEIMVGSGITEANIGALAAQTSIYTFHASLRQSVATPVTIPSRLAHDSAEIRKNLARISVSSERVRAALDNLSAKSSSLVR